MRVWNKIGVRIERGNWAFNELMAKLGFVMTIYIMSAGLYDVIMRYVFNNPSLWIWITFEFLLVSLAALGGGYAYQHDSFVRLDLLYTRFSARTRAIADIVTFPLTLLFCVMLIWKGGEVAVQSIAINQVTPTAVRLPMYPVRSLIPLGGFFVLVTALLAVIRNIKAWKEEASGQVAPSSSGNEQSS